MTVKGTLVRLLNQHLLSRWDLVLRKAGHDSENAMNTPKYRRILVQDICTVMEPFLVEETRLLPADQRERLPDLVEEFMTVYARRPVIDNTGGSGFNGSLCLFLICRLSDPELIVESGTWQGHTAWLLAQASPAADVHTFDIEPDNLRHRTPRVTYHAGDWMSLPMHCDGSRRCLAFFDDHVSHAQRITEAHRRGFRTLVFDDNLPAQGLFATGMPPLPTVAMLLDPRVQPGEVIEWTYRGRPKRYTCTMADWDAALLIAGAYRAPSLSPVTFYRPHIGITVVRLMD